MAFADSGTGFISRQAGAVSKTGNPLDVAVQGDGWLGIKTPAGIVYTRDGRMTIQELGQLTTLNSYPVLDAGGAPILLDASAGAPDIAPDGMISQKGNQVGAIGLFSIDEDAKLTRATTIPASFRTSRPRRCSTSAPMASPRAMSRDPTSIRSSR